MSVAIFIVGLLIIFYATYLLFFKTSASIPRKFPRDKSVLRRRASGRGEEEWREICRRSREKAFSQEK